MITIYSHAAHPHIDATHHTTRKSILPLKSSTALSLLWWAENWIELQIWSSWELYIQKREKGKGADWDLEEGDVRGGGFELATCVRLGRRLGESFTLCRAVSSPLHSLRNVHKGCVTLQDVRSWVPVVDRTWCWRCFGISVLTAGTKQEWRASKSQVPAASSLPTDI